MEMKTYKEGIFPRNVSPACLLPRGLHGTGSLPPATLPTGTVGKQPCFYMKYLTVSKLELAHIHRKQTAVQELNCQ